jgi:glycosyltransferase involved in cell wall biosynthesis
MTKKLITIVSPCYNEELNIDELYSRISKTIAVYHDKYDFEILFIDNDSQDKTQNKLENIANNDCRVTVIINNRNYGHIRSPYYALLQSNGDAVIYLASDLQDPPELISEFIEQWQSGFKVVMAVKPTSEGSIILTNLRKFYYNFLDSVSDVPIVKDATGFGLYDRCIIDHINQINDPYPFFRGLVAELGYPIHKIPFNQPRRLRGISKNNFYTLYDIAWLGIIGHSKVPIRISAFLGIIIGFSSLIAALIYMIAKILFWNQIPFGFSPILIGMFFLFGVQLIFLGIIGEYLGAILTYQQNRPLVVEKKRIKRHKDFER